MAESGKYLLNWDIFAETSLWDDLERSPNLETV